MIKSGHSTWVRVLGLSCLHLMFAIFSRDLKILFLQLWFLYTSNRTSQKRFVIEVDSDDEDDDLNGRVYYVFQHNY